MVSALDSIGSDQSLQEHWIKRFIALIIDAVIFWIVAWIIFIFLPIDYWWGWGFGWSLLSGVLFFLYSALMEMTMGATLGKHVLNLKVISLHGELEAGGAFVRNISKFFWLFLLIDWLVGFVTDGDPKQKFLDRVAGTTVIITDRLTDQQQHIYQSQQSDYAPPPPTQYTPHESQTYQQTGQQTTPAQQPQEAPPEQQQPQEPESQICKDCGGRMVLMGNGRLQCIRCGKIT